MTESPTAGTDILFARAAASTRVTTAARHRATREILAAAAAGTDVAEFEDLVDRVLRGQYVAGHLDGAAGKRGAAKLPRLPFKEQQAADADWDAVIEQGLREIAEEDARERIGAAA